MGSKKQSVARSNAETEYWAMIEIILLDLMVEVKEPMMLHCDNKSTLYIVHNLVHRDWTEHVKVVHLSNLNWGEKSYSLWILL